LLAFLLLIQANFGLTEPQAFAKLPLFLQTSFSCKGAVHPGPLRPDIRLPLSIFIFVCKDAETSGGEK
jgi:hypothetical protein